MEDLDGGTVIITPVWARDEAEASRLLPALERLAQYGLPIFAADNGSGEPFLDALRAMPNLQVLPKAPSPAPRLMGQIQRALAAARENRPRWALYTEPDKEWFFNERLDAFLRQTGTHPEAGVIIAARDTSSFTTFPAYQQRTEVVLNALCQDWVPGTEGADVMYGPLLFRAEVLSCLDDHTDDLGWGWRFFALAYAHRLGLPVVPWESYLPCPPDQRGEDSPADGSYRVLQLGQGLVGLAQGMRAPLVRV